MVVCGGCGHYVVSVSLGKAGSIPRSFFVSASRCTLVFAEEVHAHASMRHGSCATILKGQVIVCCAQLGRGGVVATGFCLILLGWCWLEA
jgi:hypothetical protein